MHRVWTKIVAASLIILGESAFASESTESSDDSYRVNSSTVHLLLPAVLEDTGSRSQPPLASSNTTQPDIDLAYQTLAAVTIPVSSLLEYHPFSPRAPPTPAN